MTITMIGLRGVQADYACVLFGGREKREAYPSKSFYNVHLDQK
jgi:hypothetical protein